MPGPENLRSVAAEGLVGAAGGAVASNRGEITVDLPAAAVDAQHTLVIRDRPHPQLTRPGGTVLWPLVAFDVELRNTAGRTVPGRLNDHRRLRQAAVSRHHPAVPNPVHA